MTLDLIDRLRAARVYDLEQPRFAGMPIHPTHRPGYFYALHRRHRDTYRPESHGPRSSASGVLTMMEHSGTHLDALCHQANELRMFGGVEVDGAEAPAGFTPLGVETVPPLLRRGVLLDVAGSEPLAVDHTITPAELSAAQRAEIRPGDIVLIRTGWARYFGDPKKFVSEVCGPGPRIEGARWLSERRVFAAGSDTLAFEKLPDAAMPVHVHLLVESGIHIVECLNLDELAAAGVSEFLFIALPLKIRGATGSPVRPVAIV